MRRRSEMTAAICVVVLLFAGCTQRLSEVTRSRDPDGALDAVVAIRETDATVATPTEIYVRPAGARAQGEPIFRADKVEGLKVKWLAPGTLEVVAQSARSFLEKTEYATRVDGHPRTIRIRYDIAVRPE